MLTSTRRRKDAYLAKQKCQRAEVKQAPLAVLVSDKVKNRHQTCPLSSVREIKANADVSVISRLTARVKDFYPMDIRDFCMKACTSCNSRYATMNEPSFTRSLSFRIPDKYNACMMCEDSDKEYVCWLFRFFLLLEDQEGDTIIAEVCKEAVRLHPHAIVHLLLNPLVFRNSFCLVSSPATFP